MSDNWVNFYDEFANNQPDAISQVGYISEGKPFDKMIFEDWFNQMQSHFNVRKDDYLLDVGCGSGLFLNHFAKYTDKLFGVDPAEGQVKNAQKNCPKAKIGQKNAIDAGFDNVIFDRIFCNGVFILFESLDFAERVLDRFLSISKKDALIYLGDMPMPTESMQEGSNYRRIGKSSPLELQHYPESFLLNYCNKKGLKGKYIKQEVPNKINAGFRYDYLISRV